MHINLSTVITLYNGLAQLNVDLSILNFRDFGIFIYHWQAIVICQILLLATFKCLKFYLMFHNLCYFFFFHVCVGGGGRVVWGVYINVIYIFCMYLLSSWWCFELLINIVQWNAIYFKWRDIRVLFNRV